MHVIDHRSVDMLRRVDWLRWQLSIIVTALLLLAITLAAAPTVQVVTPGTLPVLDLLPAASVAAHRIAWALWFAAAAVLLACTWHRPAAALQISGWLLAFTGMGCWTTAQAIAVLDGRGSAVALVVWLTLIAWWGTVAIGLGLRLPPSGR